LVFCQVRLPEKTIPPPPPIWRKLDGSCDQVVGIRAKPGDVAHHCVPMAVKEQAARLNRRWEPKGINLRRKPKG